MNFCFIVTYIILYIIFDFVSLTTWKNFCKFLEDIGNRSFYNISYCLKKVLGLKV
jgi:hypothetical protein